LPIDSVDHYMQIQQGRDGEISEYWDGIPPPPAFTGLSSCSGPCLVPSNNSAKSRQSNYHLIMKMMYVIYAILGCRRRHHAISLVHSCQLSAVIPKSNLAKKKIVHHNDQTNAHSHSASTFVPPHSITQESLYNNRTVGLSLTWENEKGGIQIEGDDVEIACTARWASYCMYVFGHSVCTPINSTYWCTQDVRTVSMGLSLIPRTDGPTKT